MRSRARNHRSHPSVWPLAKSLANGVDDDVRTALDRRMSIAPAMRDLLAEPVALGSPLPLASTVAPDLNPTMALDQHRRMAPPLRIGSPHLYRPTRLVGQPDRVDLGAAAALT